MVDDVIVGGIFGIVGTIVGAFVGFVLLKISDINTAKQEKKRYQNLLRFKSDSVKKKIDNIIKNVNKSEKIADLESLRIIEEFLLKNDIKEEISNLESITDKIVKSNYDEKEKVYFEILGRLKYSINYLLHLSTDSCSRSSR